MADDSLPVKGRNSETNRTARRLAVVGYGVLTVVIGCVAAMSWSGLVGFATVQLGLTAPLAYLVPVSLDGAALTSAFLALRSVTLGDSAIGARVLALAFVGSSAWFNIAYASQHRGLLAAQFFGGMSVAGWAVFELALRHVRRDALRSAGALEAPLPRFRVARWLRFPGGTFRAWSLAVEQGVTDPRDAVALTVRSDGVDANVTKEQMLRRTFTQLGELDVPKAVALLASNGVTVDRKYGYAVAKKIRIEGNGEVS